MNDREFYKGMLSELQKMAVDVTPKSAPSVQSPPTGTAPVPTSNVGINESTNWSALKPMQRIMGYNPQETDPIAPTPAPRAAPGAAPTPAVSSNQQQAERPQESIFEQISGSIPSIPSITPNLRNIYVVNKFKERVKNSNWWDMATKEQTPLTPIEKSVFQETRKDPASAAAMNSALAEKDYNVGHIDENGQYRFNDFSKLDSWKNMDWSHLLKDHWWKFLIAALGAGWLGDKMFSNNNQSSRY